MQPIGVRQGPEQAQARQASTQRVDPASGAEGAPKLSFASTLPQIMVSRSARWRSSFFAFEEKLPGISVDGALQLVITSDESHEQSAVNRNDA